MNETSKSSATRSADPDGTAGELPPPRHRLGEAVAARASRRSATPDETVVVERPEPAIAAVPVASQPDWHELYADDADELPDENSPLARRAPSNGEATGSRALLRAGFTSCVGGAIIALVSMAFGPRFFTSDVRVLGIFVGLAIVALGIVSTIGPDHRKTTSGALIIVCAILAFPVAAGGYFIGSIIAIVGGALLVAYEPPPDQVDVVVHRAGRLRRFTGLSVDFVIAFAIHRVLYALVPDFFGQTLNVVVAWVFAWVVAVVVPSLWTRRTGGRILLVERLVDAESAERARPGATLLRESIRGLVAIGGFIGIVRVVLGTEVRPLAGLIVLSVVVIAGLIGERLHLLDRLTGTVSVFDAVVPVDSTRGGEEGAQEVTEARGRLRSRLPGSLEQPAPVQ